MEFDMIVRNGIIANANDVVFGQEIGVKDGLIACIGSNLPSSPSTTIIDAKGGYITPGGVDSHVHLEQPDLRQDSDTWETGTRSAVCGGTTTVLAFAVQQKTDKSIVPLVQDYSTLARGNAACDYGFHIILSNPTKHVLETELPAIAKGLGITSVKLYMTYDAMKVDDRGILDVLIATRRLGVTTMIHAENHDMVSLITETLERDGQTDPYFHAVSRPKIAEDEASYRAIALSELMDTPILLVHVSSETTASHIRRAQSRLLPVYGETCPQYLYLLSENLRGEEFQGAKCVCSPPVRESPEDLRAMWTAISNGTFTTYSSDHCATKFNASGGKRLGLVNGIPKFSKIPNGLPGLETRQPLLFKGVLDGKISIQDFVRVSCTNPAQLYGLPTKGVIFPGKDADLCIWYAKGEMQPLQLTNAMLHHAIDYSPFEGMAFYNWPRYTILRGKVVWDRDNGGYVGKRGDGNYLKRESSMLPGPRNVFVNEWKPPAEVFEQSTRASKFSSCLDCSIQL